MLERGKLDRRIVEMVDTESLVLKGHLLRKIDAAVDFNRIYEMVEPLYSGDNGRPSIDPVVMIKYLLVGFLYGLPFHRNGRSRRGMRTATRFAGIWAWT